MIYLLGGENQYLSFRELHKLKSQMLEKDPMAQIVTIDADDAKEINDLLSQTEVIGMFSAKTIIILKRLFSNKSKKLKGEFLENIKKKPYDLLIWEDSTFDKRTSLYKFIQKEGTAIEFTHLKDKELKAWILNRFKESNIGITNQLADQLILRVGVDQNNLANEVDKLILFAKSRKRDSIEKSDFSLMTPITKEESIWELMDEISNANPKRALTILESIIKEQKDYPLVLSLFVRQLRIYFLINHLEHMPQQEISKLTGIHSFVISKSYNAAKKLSISKLKVAYERLLNLDLKIKQGIIDPKLGLDLFILSFR